MGELLIKLRVLNRAEIKCMHISHKIIGFIGVKMKNVFYLHAKKKGAFFDNQKLAHSFLNKMHSVIVAITFIQNV